MLIFLPVAAGAQSAAKGGAWQGVMALSPQTMLEVSTGSGNHHCRLVSVTDDQITCGKDTIPRSDVRRIEVEKRSRAIGKGLLIGAGIGVSGGLIGGAALGPSVWASRGKGAGVGAAVFGVAGALVGAAVGAGAGHGGETIYRR
jgi:hypothetical protein